VLGEQLLTAGEGGSSQVDAAAGSSSSWEEVPAGCDMCGAAALKAAGKGGGRSVWVWCPECAVAAYCSAGCAQQATTQGRHTWEACQQLRGWKQRKLWAVAQL
jgi:hypothetical protein